MVTFLSYFVIFNLSCKKYEFSLHLKWLTKNDFFAKKFYSLVFRREKYISFFMFKWVFWRCLQAVITLWGCERKYRLGWYLVDLPALPPRPLRGWGGGALWTGHLWFVWRLAVGRRRRPFVCFAPFGLFVSRLAPFAVSLILYPVWFVVVRAHICLKNCNDKILS